MSTALLLLLKALQIEYYCVGYQTGLLMLPEQESQFRLRIILQL